MLMFLRTEYSPVTLTLLDSESQEPRRAIFTGRQSESRHHKRSWMSRQFLAYWNRSNMLFAKKQFQGNEKGIYFLYQMNIRNLHNLKCIYVKMLIFKTQNYFLLKIALINKRFILEYKMNLSSTPPGTWTKHCYLPGSW